MRHCIILTTVTNFSGMYSHRSARKPSESFTVPVRE